MNIVKRELRANLKSLIIWSLIASFLVVVWMVEFEAFASNPYIDEFMKSIPESILSAMGMSDLNIATLDGFISTISLYLYLLLGIHSVLLGSSIISKEERDKTAEYLFALPVSRERVVIGKTIAAIINLIILNIVTLVSMLISTINYEKTDGYYSFIGLMFLAIFLIQLVFLSVGMLVSALNKRYKKSGNISVSILMVTFIISSLIGMVDSIDYLRFTTPFKYFEATYILNEGRLQPLYIVISILLIVFGLVATYIIYPRRDLYI